LAGNVSTTFVNGKNLAVLRHCLKVMGTTNARPAAGWILMQAALLSTVRLYGNGRWGWPPAFGELRRGPTPEAGLLQCPGRCLWSTGLSVMMITMPASLLSILRCDAWWSPAWPSSERGTLSQPGKAYFCGEVSYVTHTPNALPIRHLS